MKKNKNATAVKCGDEEITYEDLDKKSNYLANRLIDLGIQTGDVVGINLKWSMKNV